MTNEDYMQDTKIFCLDCQELVVPIVESYNYGSDADGNRGETRYDFTCPKCGGDDLTEDYTNCGNCSEPIELGDDYCTICRAEVRTLFAKWRTTMETLGYDSELIMEIIAEWYEGD